MSANRRLDPQDVAEIHPNYHFRWEEAQQAHLLLYPEGIVKLNETAAAILAVCDGTRPVASIVEEFSARYGAAIQDDVLNFMEVAHAKGWIRIKP